MRDDIAMTTGNSQDSGTPDITDLGNDVYQIDTRMAGYQGITAGYLIRSSRPCLVETGTSTSAPVVRDALAALGLGPADLATVVVTHIHLDHAVQPLRPVTAVASTLERSAEELSVWVDATQTARNAGMDLDHAVEAVRQRTLARYASLAPSGDPEVAEKFERLAGVEANVSGIWHWLEKVEAPAA